MGAWRKTLPVWVLGGLALLVGCGSADTPTAPPQSLALALTATVAIAAPSPQPSPWPTATFSPLLATARALKNADLQAQRDREATRAAISPAPMSTNLPTYPPAPTVVLPLGIAGYQDCGGDEPGKGDLRHFLIWNCWRGYLDGIYSGVGAGAEWTAPTPGEWVSGSIYIISHLDDMDQTSWGPIYWTPIKAGRLEIIGVANTQFTMTSSSGAIFIFDTATRQWVGLTPGPASSPGQSPLPSPASSVTP